MISEKSRKRIAFYPTDFIGEVDCFGCATFGFAGETGAGHNVPRTFPIAPEGIEIYGAYEECLHEVREIIRTETVFACIALLGNAGNENLFCRRLHAILKCPVVGGGAAYSLSDQVSGRISRGGEANLLLITDQGYSLEVLSQNIHQHVISYHKIEMTSSRVAERIDDIDARTWFAQRKNELGLHADDWEHLTLSDLNGVNTHFHEDESQLVSGRELEEVMVLRYMKQEDVFRQMQMFYNDENALIFGCAGLKSLIRQELRTNALGLFMFGEVCYLNERADFGNLMLSKIRFVQKADC